MVSSCFKISEKIWQKQNGNGIKTSLSTLTSLHETGCTLGYLNARTTLFLDVFLRDNFIAADTNRGCLSCCRAITLCNSDSSAPCKKVAKACVFWQRMDKQEIKYSGLVCFTLTFWGVGFWYSTYLG